MKFSCAMSHGLLMSTAKLIFKVCFFKLNYLIFRNFWIIREFVFKSNQVALIFIFWSLCLRRLFSRFFSTEMNLLVKCCYSSKIIPGGYRNWKKKQKKTKISWMRGIIYFFLEMSITRRKLKFCPSNVTNRKKKKVAEELLF